MANSRGYSIEAEYKSDRCGMKKSLRNIGLFLLLLAIGAGAVVTAGLVPIKASSGHWPITAWLLEFAMERSVATQSSGIVAPPLDNRALIMRGAGHYEVGCVWCHGGPGTEPPRIGLQMTPHPPNLSDEVKKWEPHELFYIVRHGVKFTGMPGWASQQREDEVWGVVAFLQEFPKLDQAWYDELSGRKLRDGQRELARSQNGEQAKQSPTPPTVVIERCVACHGADGLGRDAYPKLAGQWHEYLVGSLQAYRDARRHSGTMGPIAAGLSDSQIEEAAGYYYALESATADSMTSDTALVARGEQIAREGLVTERAGACLKCHGQPDEHRNLHYPKLAGQNAGYLIQQLHLFRAGDRGGTDHAHIMQNIAESLTDEQIEAVATYFAQADPQQF